MALFYDYDEDEYIEIDDDELELELQEIHELTEGVYNPFDNDELECIFDLVGIPTSRIIN